MRILHLLAGTGWGGAELMGCVLHQLTLARGHESRVDAPALPEIVTGVREAARIELSGPEEASTWRWAQGARARRRQFQPDIVHAHLATPSLAGAAWWIAGGTPLALTFHLLPEGPRWPNDRLLRVPSPLVLSALLRARGRCKLVVVGRADQARLEQRFPGAGVMFTPNVLSPPPSAAAASALPYPAGATRVLSVGRLVEQKGFDRMLDVVAAPELQALPWHWLIVGEGPARTALERQVAQLGLGDRVRLLGAIPSHGLFEQSDLVLCPSRYEAAPLVPREAIRAGVPVVLSGIAPHRELLAESTAGLLPEREQDWLGVLRQLLHSAEARDSLRQQQAPAGRDQSAALWEACSALYSQLLGSGRTGPHAG